MFIIECRPPLLFVWQHPLSNLVYIRLLASFFFKKWYPLLSSTPNSFNAIRYILVLHSTKTKANTQCSHDFFAQVASNKTRQCLYTVWLLAVPLYVGYRWNASKYSKPLCVASVPFPLSNQITILFLWSYHYCRSKHPYDHKNIHMVL